MATPLKTLINARVLRFGSFQIDLAAAELVKNGRTVRLQPKPFKLLCLLAGQPGRVVTREEIRLTLWESDTFVDYEQGVNFAIKQVRDALGEDADKPVFIQTLPKRGYKFIAPVGVENWGSAVRSSEPTLELQKLVWTHIADLRLAEHRHHKTRRLLLITLAIAAFVAFVALLVVGSLR